MFVLAAMLALAACGGGTLPADGGLPDGALPDGAVPDATVPDGGTPAPRCGDGIADLDRGAWDTRFGIAGLTGHDGLAPTVHDFARAPDGSIVAAGRFEWLGLDRVPPLLRLRDDGTWEPARTTWELEPPATGFSAVAYAEDGTLALATHDTFGERAGEIWIDDGTGLRVIGRLEGLVRSLAFFDGKLWVAGIFRMQGGAIEGLATWNGATWSVPPGGAVRGGHALELFVDGDRLYVGGDFNGVGGIDAARVASFDGEAWGALNLAGGWVYALARGPDGALYAGGVMRYGDSGAGGIARWTGSAWAPVGEGLAIAAYPGVVTDIVAHEGGLDVTGCFSSIGAEGSEGTRVADSLARWTGTAWESLDDGTTPVRAPWFQHAVCGDEGPTAIWEVSHQRLAHDGQRLVVGGSFAGAGGVLSQALVAHDGERWSAQGVSGLGIGGQLDRIAVGGEGCDVYGLGAFTHAAGDAGSGRLARFTGDGWDVIADSLTGAELCWALDVSRDGAVAVGCIDAPPPDGSEPEGIVLRVVDGALVRVPIAGLGPVHTVRFDDEGTLWVAGGGARGYVGTLRGDAFTLVSEGFDGSVSRVDVDARGELIAAGLFTRVGDVSARGIARLANGTWSALGEGVPGQAIALARHEDRIYVSTYDLGAGSYLLGAFDGTRWVELATAAAGLTRESHFSFEALRSTRDGLLAVGTAVLDDGSARGALVYRDGRFEALGGGVGAMWIGSVALTDDAVWIGGSIAEVGRGDARRSSVGVARWSFAR